MQNNTVTYVKNPDLPFLIENWQGNPILKGEFQYVEAPFRPDLKDLWRWQTSRNPQRAEKKADTWRLPVLTDTSFLQGNDDILVWLGHASYFIRMNGVCIITDPVWYNIAILPRLAKMPFSVSDFPKIDYILLSHDHRDHCDKKTLQLIFKQHQPEILTAMEMSSVIKSWLPRNTKIQEAAWYQIYNIADKTLKISFLPSRHWCRRGLLDFNRRLWGSFMLEANGKTIYFGSDSSKSAHFEQVGKLFPTIDYAMLGIGAYSPDYMMRDVHTTPEEAYEAFQQLGAKTMLPMHYGTYDLSDEPISEPIRRLEACAKKEDYKILSIGEVLSLP
jgi:L-ascorbate metabolism protein UlaG (beta-lactamase superfamily)